MAELGAGSIMTPSSSVQQSKNKVLILAGLLLIVIAIFFIKILPQDAATSLAGDQLSAALESGLPVVVFFHSTTCDPCMEMIENVDLAYPKFSEAVILIDVNVSDERNLTLLRSEDVRLIPSLKFFDTDRQSRIVYGVITPEQIQAELSALLEP